MRIYFTGSHSTGKTTLAKYVSDKYGISFIPEVARMVLSEQELQIDNIRRNLEMINKYQQEVFSKQIKEENKYGDNFVSDRCALDVLAYAAQHTSILPTLLKSQDLKDYIEKLFQKGSRIFFVRPCKSTLVQDGVRELINWEGVITIDAQIKYILESFGLSYFPIHTDNIQERIRLIDSILYTL